MDGTKYEYSKNYTKLSMRMKIRTSNEAYTVVLDANGYVVYSDASDSTEDYVYVAKLAETGGAKATWRLTLLHRWHQRGHRGGQR